MAAPSPTDVHKIQVVIKALDDVPADAAVWDFHVLHAAALDGTAGQNVCDLVKVFILSQASRLGATVATTGHTMKIFDLRDPKPRVPEFEYGPFSLTPAITDGPREVALCVSWKAEVPSGAVRQRYYNRFYFGPINGFEVQAVRPQSTFLNSITGAFKTMVDGINALTPSGDYVFCAYSPKDGIGRPVVKMWADNEWDTQRRRGLRATAKTVVLPA